MSYEYKNDKFSGPLDKLLELIEEKKLEITAFSLAEVTADFLSYLKNLAEETKHPSVIADFVVVASRLLLIKSKTLLPSLELSKEEEGDIKDLETRLKIYKEYKNASVQIKQKWDENKQLFSRQFLQSMPTAFCPPPDLSINDLEKSIKNVVKELQTLVPEKQSIKKVLITLKGKMEELLERLQKKANQSFCDMSCQKSKIEVIMIFLAILHLLREKIIHAEQKGQFSDIIINKSEAVAASALPYETEEEQIKEA
ncbi:MAG: segregation/condensation protein A [Candidatus Pacebacteria bacterium]|nr:segregation/condensation protein A [Candidatus Paceibacterota bacterium]